jgi:hypothetical protein
MTISSSRPGYSRSGCRDAGGRPVRASYGTEFSLKPITYEDMRLGCYDPAARVADMDTGHVLASMLFPSFPDTAAR